MKGIFFSTFKHLVIFEQLKSIKDQPNLLTIYNISAVFQMGRAGPSPAEPSATLFGPTPRARENSY